ncbi:MAG: amidohydrolase family protein [Nitrospinae bacterium]|nr:amidohydrolase family protein [Nitrospinota bacterium]
MKTMRIKFRHLIAPTGEGNSNGEMIVENGQIREVLSSPLESFEGETLDLSDCLVLPGFINLHCHLSLSALKNRVPKTQSMVDWIKSILVLNASLSLPERIKMLRSGLDTQLRSGVTTVADFLSMPELLGEYAAFPLRLAVFLEVFGFNGKEAPAIAEKIKSNLAEFCFERPLFSVGLAPHAPYTVSPPLFKKLREIADASGLSFSCHVSEFDEEEKFIREGRGEIRKLLQDRGMLDAAWKPFGESSCRYLDSMGVLDSMIAVHLNFLEGDLDLLASKKVAGAFCPGSARWFGRTKWMPVRQMLDRNILVGIGTDSLASNDSLNFFRELRITEEMLPEVSRREILDMATRQGAEALNLKTGVMGPGFSADLIALRVDEDPANWLDPVFDPQRQEVDLAMVEGEVVFQQ